MSDPPKPEEGLGGLVERAVPAGGIVARQSLSSLQAKLFGQRQEEVKVSRYVLRDRIASGGGGTVYSGHDPKLDRKVAIKLLHAGHDANQAQGRVRLLREAQSLAKLSHPNIVEVYDVGTYDAADLGAWSLPGEAGTDDGVFVVMEFVEGRNLAEWLAIAPRTWREIRDVFLAAGRGLAAAHARGIVHRDFKPANVLVGGDGRVRVLDFGLARATRNLDTKPHTALAARIAEGVRELAGPLDISLTMTGAMLGTPAYMAPEQHQGKKADARSDQYSLSLALYEGWYGCPPFPVGAAAELQEAKRKGEFMPPPRDARVPARFLPVLHRGLQPDPDDRFESIEELLEELDWDPRFARRRRLTIGGAAIVTVAAGFGVWKLAIAPQTVCDDVYSRAAEAWDEQKAAQVSAAVHGLGKPWSPATAEQINKRLGEYIAAWGLAANEACEATHVRGEQSEELLRLRNACLDRPLAQMRVTVDAIVEGNPPAAERGIDATAALPDLARCADVESLLSDGASGTEPTNIENRQKADAIRITLAEAAGFEATGQAERGLELVAGAVMDADALGFTPVQVEALLRRGSLEAEGGMLVEAERTLEDALWSAASIDHDDVAAAAASRLVHVVGGQPGRSADGHLWARHAEAAGKRAGVGNSRRARLLADLGRMLIAERRYDEAGTKLESGLALLEGSQRPERLSLLLAMGESQLRQGNKELAATTLGNAVTVADTIYSAEHPTAALARHHLGRALLSAGRHDEAKVRLERALAIIEAGAGADDDRLAPILIDLATVRLELDDASEAAGALRRALTMLSADAAPRLVADARFGLAQVNWELGRRGDKTTRLAAQARDAYEALGHQELRDAVESWLASRG